LAEVWFESQATIKIIPFGTTEQKTSGAVIISYYNCRKQFLKAQRRQQAPRQTNSQIGAGKNPHFTKKTAASGRSGPHKRQRVNLIAQGADTSDKIYADAASSAAEKVDDDAICEYD